MLHPFIMERLSPITEEERAILGGQTVIDRDLYMDGTHDIITGDKLFDAVSALWADRDALKAAMAAAPIQNTLQTITDILVQEAQ